MSQQSGTVASDPAFTVNLPEPEDRRAAMFPPPVYRRAWTHRDLLSIFPPKGIRVLDIGAGWAPLQLREQDELVTTDFESEADAEVTTDVTSDWPFGEREFDLINMSHVLEHFYPNDRDAVIRNVYNSLKPGGLVFIRVPHRSSFHSRGWEHHTSYGLGELTSLCHGHNPMLPMFRCVSVGASTSLDFYGERSAPRRLLERGLSRYWRLTDKLLANVVGGIPEVQFMLQRMGEETEQRLRRDSNAYIY
ncbi:MAG: Methyltransferase domain [Gaiellales bacterium]|nr:Methyltransferase domain [Gaiellales bacterium]